MKIDFKIPKININFAKQMPYILAGLFMAIGIFVLGFGYILFNRGPEASVKTAASQEVNNLTINVNMQKVHQLFDSGYDTSGIKNPGYQTKDPFAGF